MKSQPIGALRTSWIESYLPPPTSYTHIHSPLSPNHANLQLPKGEQLPQGPKRDAHTTRATEQPTEMHGPRAPRIPTCAKLHEHVLLFPMGPHPVQARVPVRHCDDSVGGMRERRGKGENHEDEKKKKERRNQKN